jgi:hypothetical protein
MHCTFAVATVEEFSVDSWAACALQTHFFADWIVFALATDIVLQHSLKDFRATKLPFGICDSNHEGCDAEERELKGFHFVS